MLIFVAGLAKTSVFMGISGLSYIK